MNSFFMIGAVEAVKHTKLYGLYEVLDWHAIEKHLTGLYKHEVLNAGGQVPYAPLAMFKAVLLGQWHELSDNELEHALKTRLDYMVFTGFAMGDNCPDASTLCRFRNRLANAGKDALLLQEVNRQLERLGIKVKATRGAIIDATIIQSAARPRKVLEAPVEGEVQQSSSADAQAAWLKKGKQSHYGYRGYGVVDTEDGYVEHVELTPANVSEMTQLQPVMTQTLAVSTGIAGLLADKGFGSQANRQYLKDKGLADLMQFRAARAKPFTDLETCINKIISTLRYKVERCFGTLKRRFGLGRARYFGVMKTRAQMVWAALGYNLLKGHRKLQRSLTLAHVPQGTLSHCLI